MHEPCPCTRGFPWRYPACTSSRFTSCWFPVDRQTTISTRASDEPYWADSLTCTCMTSLQLPSASVHSKKGAVCILSRGQLLTPLPEVVDLGTHPAEQQRPTSHAAALDKQQTCARHNTSPATLLSETAFHTDSATAQATR